MQPGFNWLLLYINSDYKSNVYSYGDGTGGGYMCVEQFHLGRNGVLKYLCATN